MVVAVVLLVLVLLLLLGPQANTQPRLHNTHPAVVAGLLDVVVVVVAELGVFAVATGALLSAWRPFDLAVPVCAALSPTLLRVVVVIFSSQVVAALHGFERSSFILTLCFSPPSLLLVLLWLVLLVLLQHQGPRWGQHAVFCQLRQR